MTAPVTIGVSLKLYFGHARTLEYLERIADIAAVHPAILGGNVELFAIPSFTEIPAAITLLGPVDVAVGAQDAHWEDEGAYTGEVSPAVLAELGVRYVELGHAERRAMFGETDEIVGRKVDAALRNGLVPLICVGEGIGQESTAVQTCLAQLDAALAPALTAGRSGSVIVAYEPVWAIGAERSAPASHIAQVCSAIGEHLAGLPLKARVIYGGSAGPGLLGEVGPSIDGLFLGRRAHDPNALAAVLDEALRDETRPHKARAVKRGSAAGKTSFVTARESGTSVRAQLRPATEESEKT